MANEHETLLGPIASEEHDKKKEFTSRKDPVYYKTVKKHRLGSYIDKGWEYAKKVKDRHKNQKSVPRDYTTK